MKTMLMAAVIAMIASPVGAQSVDNDLPRVQCRNFPFPFSVMCLANAAAYRDMKPCAEIGQTSIKPAGQQCDAGRGEARAFGSFSREPRGRDCDHEKETY